MRRFAVSSILVLFIVFSVGAAFAAEGSNARMPAIKAGANRLMYLQRTNAGWEGTWYWFVGNTANVTNLTGVTALGLLEAFRDAKDPAYLDACKKAAAFAMAHLGSGAVGTPYSARWTAPDVIFVHHLGKVTADEAYTNRAAAEWGNIKVTYPTAVSLDTKFRALNRPSTWDLAFFLEAAYLSGDQTWANDAAAIIANTGDTFYYSESNPWYALNLAGTIRALVNCGYAEQHKDAIVQMFTILIGMCDGDNGIDGYIQDSAYAIMAFNSVGGPARSYANELARWLSSKRTADGGWIDGGVEYPEVNGETVRALASTIGTNFTLDGFEPGVKPASVWKKSIPGQAVEPFNED